MQMQDLNLLQLYKTNDSFSILHWNELMIIHIIPLQYQNFFTGNMTVRWRGDVTASRTKKKKKRAVTTPLVWGKLGFGRVFLGRGGGDVLVFYTRKKITETTKILKLNNLASFLQVIITIFLFFSFLFLLSLKKIYFFSHVLSSYHPKNSFSHSNLSIWLKETIHLILNSN